MENQLIQLYLLVCQIYDNQSSLKYQRLSNFKTRFTDQELVTVYLFGHLNGLYQKKAIYRLTRNYWAAWFPALPSYQAFSNRLNNMESSFQIISQQLLRALAAGQTIEVDHLVDSFPVMLAKAVLPAALRSLASLPQSVIARQSDYIFMEFVCICWRNVAPVAYPCRLRFGFAQAAFTI
jgi:hypothetical protein